MDMLDTGHGGCVQQAELEAKGWIASGGCAAMFSVVWSRQLFIHEAQRNKMPGTLFDFVRATPFLASGPVVRGTFNSNLEKFSGTKYVIKQRFSGTRAGSKHPNC